LLLLQTFSVDKRALFCGSTFSLLGMIATLGKMDFDVVNTLEVQFLVVEIEPTILRPISQI